MNNEENPSKNSNQQRAGKIMQNYSHASKIQQEKHEQNFWDRINEEMQVIDSEKEEFKTQELPLSRIKRLMKLESEILDESAKYMVSSEAPILFAKACEIFILELTLRSWKFADDEKRRTLLSTDITKAVSRSEMYDFLIDIIPREDVQIQDYLQHIKNGPTLTIPNPPPPSEHVGLNTPLPLRPLTTSQSSLSASFPSQSQHSLAPTPTYMPYSYAVQAQNQSGYSHNLAPNSSLPMQSSHMYSNYSSSGDHSGHNTTTYYPPHLQQQQHQLLPQHLHHPSDLSSSSPSSYSSIPRTQQLQQQQQQQSQSYSHYSQQASTHQPPHG